MPHEYLAGKQVDPVPLGCPEAEIVFLAITVPKPLLVERPNIV